jgi:hypothetical protein
VVLGLWTAAVERLDPNVRTWAYMDDRTLALVNKAPRSVMTRAIHTTNRFDAAVGFQNNAGKEQTWHHSVDTTDNAGQTGAPAATTAHAAAAKTAALDTTAPIASAADTARTAAAAAAAAANNTAAATAAVAAAAAAATAATHTPTTTAAVAAAPTHDDHDDDNDDDADAVDDDDDDAMDTTTRPPTTAAALAAPLHDDHENDDDDAVDNDDAMDIPTHTPTTAATVAAPTHGAHDYDDNNDVDDDDDGAVTDENDAKSDTATTTAAVTSAASGAATVTFAAAAASASAAAAPQPTEQQPWPIEHLGLRLHPGDHTVPIVSRHDWPRVLDTIDRLGHCPGGMAMRTTLAAAYIRPLLDWAAPFQLSPPPFITKALYKAISGTRCTWWCQARWWAERIGIHPGMGVAIRGLIAGGPLLRHHSRHLETALHAHARTLNLRITELTHNAIRLEPLPTADDRLYEHIATTYRDHDGTFSTAHTAAAHTLRLAARLVVLASVKRSRHDSEAVDDIDVEASSSKTWSTWVRGLSDNDRTALNIWRGGAVRTPTRRYWRPDYDGPLTQCPWCSAPQASARHFFVECPRFEDDRRRLQQQHNIPPTWWANQPRCTTKTGWITHGAAPRRARRAHLQVAACTLGLAIVHASPVAGGDDAPQQLQ